MNVLRMPILISILFSASFAGAQIQTKSVKSSAKPQGDVTTLYHGETLADLQATQRFHFSAGYISYIYEEPQVMKISGSMLEVGGHFRHSLASTKFLIADLRYAGGSSLTYDGGMQNLKTGEQTKHSSSSADSIVNAQLLFGSSLNTTPYSNVEIFGGLGRWQLNNKIAGAGSYAREAVYLYLPVGVKFARKFSNTLTYTGGFDLNVFLSGQTTSKLSDIAPSNPDIVHQQSSGSGYKIKAGTEYKVNDKYTLLAGLYYQVWNIAPSNVVRMDIGDGKTAGLVEPLNRTTMLGLTAGAAF